jgi:uncharacterized DUF497 family protein
MWWMLPLATAGLGIFSAFQQSKSQANQVKHDLALKKQQIEWNNHMQNLELARKNRAIAQQNAAQMANNWNITEAAFEQAEEDRMYLRMKIDNELGLFSTESQVQGDELLSRIEGRGMNPDSQNARQATFMLREGQNNVLSDQMIAYSNEDISIDRGRDAALSKRNHSYNTYLKFVSTPSQHIQPDETASAVEKNMLTMGLLNTGINAAVSFKQAHTQHEIQQFQREELATLKRGTADVQELLKHRQNWSTSRMASLWNLLLGARP